MNRKKAAKELKELRKKNSKFLGEFKEFALRGNIMDLAVGIIIGGAFQSIVNSLVKDIVMPLIGLVLGKMDYSDLFLVLGTVPENTPAAALNSLSAAKEADLTVFAYGSFLSAIVNFIIMAIVIFLFVRGINRLRRKSQEPAAPTTKKCPFCCSDIDIKALRCPLCTSNIPEESDAE